jgi:uncharacterized protein
MSTQFLILVTFALAAGALVKGATGLGLPIVAMPVMASFIGVPHAIAIMTVPIIITNIWQVWQLREAREEARFLVPMLGCGTIGIGLGTVLLAALPAAHMSLALGLALAAYIVLRLARPGASIGAALRMRLAWPFGFTAGLMQGATGLSAPIGVPFIHALNLGRNALVFSISAMFLVFALVQIAALWGADLLDGEYLLQGLFAMIPVLVFMPIGTMIGRRMNRRAFDIVFLSILAIIAINLIWSSLGAIVA